MIRTPSRVDQRYDGAGPGRSMLAFGSSSRATIVLGMTFSTNSRQTRRSPAAGLTLPPGQARDGLLAFAASANRQDVVACLQVGLSLGTRLRDPAALTDRGATSVSVAWRSGQFVSRLHQAHHALLPGPGGSGRDGTLQARPALAAAAPSKPCQRGNWSPRTGPHPPVELVTSDTRLSHVGRRRPCPHRARRIGPQRSPTDNHGRCPCPPSCTITPSGAVRGCFPSSR